MTNLAQRIDAAVQSALDQKRVVGAVIAVMQDGDLAHLKAYGLANREAGVPMKTDALFRLASITKPIVTAAAMRMIELGRLSLDAAVTDDVRERTRGCAWIGGCRRDRRRRGDRRRRRGDRRRVLARGPLPARAREAEEQASQECRSTASHRWNATTALAIVGSRKTRPATAAEPPRTPS